MRKHFFCLACLMATAMMLQAQDIQRHECWIDSDYAHRQTLGSGDSITVSFSIESLAPGMHFFNHRALNTSNVWGALNRTLFFIQSPTIGNYTRGICEYWVDEDYDHKVTTSRVDSVTTTIDIGPLNAGLHFFNFRAVSDKGEYGVLSRTMFFIPQLDSGNMAIAEYEYWIDEEQPRLSNDGFENELLLVVDVSGLDDGEHTFSFHAKNSNGMWGELYSEHFIIDKSQWEDGVKGLLIFEGRPFDVYSTDGVLVRQQATSIKGLRPGIYIIGGHKVIVY